MPGRNAVAAQVAAPQRVWLRPVRDAQEVTGKAVELRLLGVTEALRDGVAAPLGGPLQRAVLADLALCAPLTVPVEQLVDDLWDMLQPASATHTMRTYVSRLRRVLAGIGCPDILVTSGPGYRLDVATSEVDALFFAELVGKGRTALIGQDPAGAAQHLRRALSLWRGPALADVRQAAFAGPAAAQLEGSRLGAAEALLDARLQLGEHVDLVSELERLVASHPLREHLHARADDRPVPRRAPGSTRSALSNVPATSLSHRSGSSLAESCAISSWPCCSRRPSWTRYRPPAGRVPGWSRRRELPRTVPRPWKHDG